MTQAEVDEHESSKDDSGGAVPVSSPAPAAGNSTGAVASDSSGTNSGLAAGAGTGNGGGDSGDDKAAAAAGGAVGIAFACFVIGAIFGGVPALMYFRSFRYEQMRGGGHSYEMT